MHLVKRYYVETIAILLVLITALAFALTKWSHQTEVLTRTITINTNDIDYQSYFNDFYDVELYYEDGVASLTATKDFDSSLLSLIDVVSMNETEMPAITTKYEFEYDAVTNIYSLSATLYGAETGVVFERVLGIPFLTETGEIDIAFNMDGEIIYLSQMNDASVINNCGWFSKLAKAILVVAVAAVVVVAVAAVVYVAAPVIIPLATTALSTGGGTMAVAGSAAAVAAAQAAAAGVVSAGLTTAIIATATAASLEVVDQVIEFSNSKGEVRALAEAIIAAISYISLDRVYYFAYVYGPKLNIIRSVPLNYIEAYVVLQATRFVNGASQLGKLAEAVAKCVISADVKGLIEQIKNNAEVRSGYVGIYTDTEADAAKLAYAAGGLFQGKYTSEIHDNTPGSGYYYHFHDAAHALHVWYGPAM